MNEGFKKVATNVGSIALLTGAACLTFTAGGELTKNVIGGVLTGLLTNVVDKADLNKIRKLIDKPKPSELNHDLEKLISKALVWTVDNITYLYKGYATTKEQEEALKSLKKSMIAEIKAADLDELIKNEQVIQQIDGLAEEQLVVEDFFNRLDQLPAIVDTFPFPAFFKEKFVANFQLCFVELLKKKDNHAALVAYNRNILTHIQTSLQDNQASILHELRSSKEDFQKMLAAVDKEKITLTETRQVENSVTLQLDAFTQELQDNVSLLVDGQGKIIGELSQLQTKADIHTQKLERVHEKVAKDNKIKFVYAIVIPLLAVGAAYLIFKYWQSQQPFLYTVQVENGSGNQNLPFDGAQVTLTYGDKTEELDTRDEALFKNLPSAVRGDSGRVTVKSFGFHSIDTLLHLTQDGASIVLERDNTYGQLTGVVNDMETLTPLAGASVSILSLTTTTDSMGRFTLDIPEDMQKTNHRISIQKEGYKIWTGNEPIQANVELIRGLEKDESN